MRDVSKALWLISCVMLGGCATSVAENESDLELEQELPIQFSPLYSAYDGEHTFQVAPFLSSTTGQSESSAIVASTLRWTVDRSFVEQENFDGLPHGVLLTTKRSGKTKIRVTALTQDGAKKTGEAFLFISRATRAEWEAGAAFYHQSSAISEPVRSGLCGMSAERTAELLRLMPGCVRCHAGGASFARPPTPLQTAGLDDDRLLQVFSAAAEPPSGVSSSPFLQQVPNPDCAFERFHTWELTESEKKGLVWQLRAIPPAMD